MLEKLINKSTEPIQALVKSKKIDLRVSITTEMFVYDDQTCIQKVISQFLQLAAWQVSERDPIIKLTQIDNDNQFVTDSDQKSTIRLDLKWSNEAKSDVCPDISAS